MLEKLKAMPMGNKLILVGVVLLIALMSVIIYGRVGSEKDELGSLSGKKKGKGAYVNGVYRILYQIYLNTPILRRYLFKIESRVKHVYPADPISIRKKVCERLLISTLIVAVGVILAVFAGKGDVFYSIAVIASIVILADQITNNAFSDMELTILEQFSDYLDAVIHFYHKKAIVEFALKSAMETQPYEIGLHAGKISNIISSTPDEMNAKISQYTETQPNKFMLTFLSICSAIKVNGDKKLKSHDNQSLFLYDIHILKNEVRAEILRKKKNNKSFKMLAEFCLVIILMIKPYQSFIGKYMPELTPFYSGVYGIAIMLVSFAISIAAYQAIAVLRDNGAGKEQLREDSIWTKIASIPILSQFIRAFERQNYTKSLRINEDLRTIGDHTGVRAFYAKKVTMGIVAFIAAFLICVGGTLSQKADLAKDFVGAFETSIAIPSSYKSAVEETAKNYMDVVDEMDESEVNVDTVAKHILDNTSVSNKTVAKEIATLVLERKEQLKNTYFEWYYLLISMLIAFIAFKWPDIFLKFRGRAIKQRKEDEVMQFQSLMMILMHINGTTLPIILEWMERFSYCFKQTIAECRTRMSIGTTKALEIMKERESGCQSFCHFVDNLIDIDSAGVEKAFDELQADRQFKAKEREQNEEFSLESRTLSANAIMLIPLATFILLYILVPSGMYAAKMFTTMMQMRS